MKTQMIDCAAYFRAAKQREEKILRAYGKFPIWCVPIIAIFAANIIFLMLVAIF